MYHYFALDALRLWMGECVGQWGHLIMAEVSFMSGN